MPDFSFYASARVDIPLYTTTTGNSIAQTATMKVRYGSTDYYLMLYADSQYGKSDGVRFFKVRFGGQTLYAGPKYLYHSDAIYNGYTVPISKPLYVSSAQYPRVSGSVYACGAGGLGGLGGGGGGGAYMCFDYNGYGDWRSSGGGGGGGGVPGTAPSYSTAVPSASGTFTYPTITTGTSLTLSIATSTGQAGFSGGSGASQGFNQNAGNPTIGTSGTFSTQASKLFINGGEALSSGGGIFESFNYNMYSYGGFGEDWIPNNEGGRQGMKIKSFLGHNIYYYYGNPGANGNRLVAGCGSPGYASGGASAASSPANGPNGQGGYGGAGGYGGGDYGSGGTGATGGAGTAGATGYHTLYCYYYTETASV